MREKTKKCPFCAEIIKVEAVVCRYCGRELESSLQVEKPKDKERPQKVSTVIALVIILFGCFLLWSLGRSGRDNNSPTTARVTASNIRATNALPPTKALTPIQAVTEEIGGSISGDNVTVDIVDDILFVTFSAQDMLSKEWTLQEIASDILQILYAINTGTVAYEAVSIQATFPLRDSFGVVKDGVVFSGSYSKDTIDKINFDGQVQVFSITDEPAYIHPDLLAPN